MDRHFEKLQNLSDDKKMMIMWIGAPLTAALIIYGWFMFAGFGFNETIAKKPVESEKISKLEVFKNGFNATLQEVKSFIEAAKEKISKTELFNAKTPESPESKMDDNLKTAEVKDVFEAASEVGTTSENSIFKITSVQVGTTSENSIFKITSVQVGTTSENSALKIKSVKIGTDTQKKK